ncbi:hypothetical protein AB4406_11030 [Vibrio splendidus]
MQNKEASKLVCYLNEETLILTVTFDVKDEEGSDIQLMFTINDVAKLMNLNEIRYDPFILEGTERQVTPTYGNRKTNTVCFGYRNGEDQTGTVYYNQQKLTEVMQDNIAKLWQLQDELKKADG